MNMLSDVSAEEPTIVMSRLYDAPRDLVWEAMTQAHHVRQWWGGPGFSNPVCVMDVRPGGLWDHVMRFPDGSELHMRFVFIEVQKPTRLVLRHADDHPDQEGLPAAVITVTLDEQGRKTRWNIVARFQTLAERDAAVSMGFSKPIEASSEGLVEHLKSMNNDRMTS
jgi:uncharacterized protein YndB with AHSA1/START domain